ncbi:MAG TPA: GNAT family N-acetyltransferase, partial [Phototrophicaceae bacterium]|nr:GNAT family N-acetyltransferase [Phototrophicaceae bacterium]
KKITEWLASGDNYRAVCLKDTGQLIGFVSLNDEDGQPQTLNLGYIFNFDYHGQGFATEACRAIISNAFERPSIQTIIAGTAAANFPSRHLLEKLGFKKKAEKLGALNTTEDGQPFEFLGYTYAISKEEWEVGKRS